MRGSLAKVSAHDEQAGARSRFEGSGLRSRASAQDALSQARRRKRNEQSRGQVTLRTDTRSSRPAKRRHPHNSRKTSSCIQPIRFDVACAMQSEARCASSACSRAQNPQSTFLDVARCAFATTEQLQSAIVRDGSGSGQSRTLCCLAEPSGGLPRGNLSDCRSQPQPGDSTPGDLR